jgi:hypothetical protein
LKIIGSKKEIRKIFDALQKQHSDWTSDESIKAIHINILKQKIRFPVLEYFAELLFEIIPNKHLYKFLDKLIALDEIGSYTIAGKLLQLNLKNDFSGSHKKANEYILQGNVWYACDMISERVLGVMLLNHAEETITINKKQIAGENFWLIRSVGVATHLATKWGLPKKYAIQQFELLLGKANVTDYHATTGIGWAAKTIAKFHPDIIKQFEKELDSPNVKQWFKTKVKIGLGRSAKYATKYTS